MVFVSVGHISPSIILSTSIHGVTDGKLSLFLWQNNIPLYPPRARQLGMWSQGGLRKHHYKQASRRDGISVEMFQILKDDAVKVLHSYASKSGKHQWPQDWKRSVFIPIPKKGNAKECSNYRTIALISHASKVMLKILQTSLEQHVNHELPDVQAAFRKGRGTRHQTANIRWIIEKARKFQKDIYFCFIDYAKPFDCVDHNKLWKILREMGIPDHLTCLLRNLYEGQEATVRTGHGTTDWFQIGKGVRQGCILSPCLFNSYAEYIMRNAGLKKHKLESRFLGEISITSDTQMTPPLWQKVKRN